MSIKPTIFDISSVNMKKKSQNEVHFQPWRSSLVNLLISDKAQKMVRDVPLTNIYNRSTNN